MAQEKSKPVLVLLPGFDGTGRLCTPLVRALSGQAETRVISYRREALLGYSELTHEVSHGFPDRPFLLVAESFGGPIALQIASKRYTNLRGIVLSASFVTNPRPILSLLFDFIVGPKLFQVNLPRWFVRHFLVGNSDGKALIEATRSASRSVSPDVLAFRLKEIIRVDARQYLAECPVPLMYLRAIEDKLVGPESLDIMKRVRPDLEVREVHGPHLLLQAAPEICAKEILQFARKVI